MQSVSSRIWTRVAVSISYDDNHYPTGTSSCRFEPIQECVIDFISLDFSIVIEKKQTNSQVKAFIKRDNPIL